MHTANCKCQTIINSVKSQPKEVSSCISVAMCHLVTVTYGFWLAIDMVNFIRLSHVLC